MTQDLVIAILGVIASMIGSASLINWRLKQLESRVDSHNNYAMKFSECTTDIKLIQQDIDYIKQSIAELKEK